MAVWMLPNITDYWDQRVDAIERLSRLLADTPEEEREGQADLIGAAVQRHAKKLSDADLTKFAVPIVEDLYKAGCQRSYIDEPLLQYLEASTAPYFRELSERGYTVHYFIDNTWDRLDGPALAFPVWFGAASLIYICPQQIACHAFEKDRPQEEWPALVARYSGRARDVANQIADRCHEEGRHFVFLDIDTDDFPAALKPIGKPGAICIFRNEAPVPGSRCAVNLPREPRRSAPAASPALRDSEPGASEAPIQSLIEGLLDDDEEARRLSRQALRAALKSALAGGGSLPALKAHVEAFRDAGWALIGRAKYGDGQYTLAAVINTLVDTIPTRPEVKTWLPLLIEPRLKTFMAHPVAELDGAASSTLETAINDAGKF